MSSISLSQFPSHSLPSSFLLSLFLISDIADLILDEGLEYVAKFDNNGSCMWMSGVNVSNPNVRIQTGYQTDSHIAIDSNDNIYLASQVSSSASSSQTLKFGNISISFLLMFSNPQLL